MDSGTRDKLSHRYVVGTFVAQIVVTLVVVLVVLPFEFDLFTQRGWWSRFLSNFFYGLVYANCCGWLGFGVMPYIANRLSTGTQFHRWTVLITALVAIGIVGSMLALLILGAIGLSPWNEYWERFWGGLQIVIVISVVTGMVWFLFESSRYRAHFASSQARLAALESKIQPHFLFNTLNSIAALIPENPEAAERMTVQLSALLRSSLDSTQGTVRLEQEMKIVTDYLEIEKARFGPRLSYILDVPSELLNRAVPPFSIQTLVENSVKYGGEEIRIRAQENNGIVAIDVWDSGKGFAADSIRPGHGLHNLRLRLALLWGARATLDVIPESAGSLVRFTVPKVISE